MKKYIKASRGDACIGIWWYTDTGDVWGLLKPVDDGVLVGPCFQYSDHDNHQNQWNHMLELFVPEELHKTWMSKGYRSLERGSVAYNTLTQVYEVICSNDLVNNSEFRTAIQEYYNLSDKRVEFMIGNE